MVIIKITGCRSKEYWYKALIGQEFLANIQTKEGEENPDAHIPRIEEDQARILGQSSRYGGYIDYNDYKVIRKSVLYEMEEIVEFLQQELKEADKWDNWLA